jgi:hypothetical protein
MLNLIQLKYTWQKMADDIQEFSRGCSLCSIYKTSNNSKNELGTPRIVLKPAKFWQIDICSGLNAVNGQKSFLTCIDMYTGFVIAVPLKNENTENIAKVVENYIIKIFGPPTELSSDNAANLTGPAMKKLCAFYNIKYRNTVPYSPTSHALVEIANRYITQLLRIFSDQFQTHWPNVICLATLIYNSVPRPQLMGHSPFYMLFQREPFEGNEFNYNNVNNLDVSEYIQRSINDRVFTKILRERLLKIREQRNKAKQLPYRSYPKGSLILVRDLRPKVNKKMKQIYFKLPQKVISEYRCTVYASDLFGRIRKHSKNNIRLLSPRGAELFSKLPEDIKIILGDEINEKKWNEIKDTGIVPAYLADIEIEGEMGRKTRGNISDDSHLIETTPPQNAENNTETLADEGEGDEIEELFSDDLLEKLNVLYDRDELRDPNLSLKDIPKLYDEVTSKDPDPAVRRRFQDNQVLDRLGEDGDLIDGEEDEVEANADPAGINIENILPYRTRRRVRFNLPQLN